MNRAVLVSLALVLFSAHANAQEESSFHILFNGGYSLPQKPDIFKDVWNNGFNVGGGVGYRFVSWLTVQGLVNYDRFSIDENGVSNLFEEEFGVGLSGLDLGLDFQGGQISLLSLTGEVKASFVADPSKVSPYVVGGGGVGRLSIDDATVAISFLGERLEETLEGESETKAMATVGGGVDIPIGGRIAVFVEGRYHLVFTSEERTDFAGFRGGVRLGL
jgi:opacity protein-like surface antigen